MALHRYDSIKPSRQNTRIYKLMTEYGRDRFYIELIEDYPCENTYPLRKREGELIREMKPTLNIVIPTRTGKERKEDEPEKIKLAKAISDAKYREKNAEQIKQKQKEYRETHREHINQKIKEYREAHREYINQKKKEFYYQHHEQELEKRRNYKQRVKQKQMNLLD